MRAAGRVVVDGDHTGEGRAVGLVTVALAQLPAAVDAAVDRAVFGALHELLDVDHVDHLRGAVVVGVGGAGVAATDGPEHEPVVRAHLVPGATGAGAGLAALVARAHVRVVGHLDLGHAVVPDLLPLAGGVGLDVGDVGQEEDAAAAHRAGEEALGRPVGLGALHDPDVAVRRVRGVLEALRHVGHRDQLRLGRVGDVPDPRRRPEGALVDGLQRIGAELPGVGVVVGHHPAQVGPGLDAVRVAARPHRPGLLGRAGLGDPAGVAAEDGADLAGRDLGLLHQALGGVGFEHHDGPRRPAVVRAHRRSCRYRWPCRRRSRRRRGRHPTGSPRPGRCSST